ncbi:IS110 family transposase [Paenibacillus melissococcoides]|nr:IS110 family transposase [Paenibacillus melissococcoides]CAH8708592.1 IS110 family transposase [Paenibacillus melissococcoides]CAH8718645.1 IS110 family transposase [Paenibacillus melissococcoides]
MYLHEDEALQQLNAKVFTINPKLINKFKDAYADLDKTDRIDAWIIADRLRFGRLTTTIVMQEQYIALQRLTRMRFHLVHNLTREKHTFCKICSTSAMLFARRWTVPCSAMPSWNALGKV